MVEERILDRIRKMLALANDKGATDGERENAMRAVHKTLAKYNLSMAEVERSGRSPGEKRIVGATTFYGRPWAQVCASSIAKLCFCAYVVGPAKRAVDTRHFFIGKESNSITAAHMSEYIVASIRREARKRQRDMGLGNAYARSFATGAAAMIAKRVEDMMRESETMRGDGKSLVLASVYQQEEAANEEVKDRNLKTRRSVAKAKRDQDWNAHAHGARYGEGVSLNRQIDSPTPKPMLR